MRINGLKAEWLIILILLAVIALQRACHKNEGCKQCEDCVVINDTVIVTPKNPKPVKVTPNNYKPKPDVKIAAKPESYETFDIVRDSLPCDTAALLNYYSSYIYKDTVYNNDSTIVVTINDSVSKNAIQSRAVFIKDRKPIAIIKPTLLKPEKKRVVINVGLILGTNFRQFSVEPTVAIQTKRDDIILGGVDIISQPVMYKAGYLLKLSFNKRK